MTWFWRQWGQEEKGGEGLPGGPTVKNPPPNAGDTGSIPGGGTKIPHTTGQLSPRATTTELGSLNERAHVLQTTEMRREPCATTTESPCMPQLERSLSATMKSPCTATKTWHSQKNKKEEKFYWLLENDVSFAGDKKVRLS